MDKLTKDYLLAFYSNLLKRHGDKPEALRWTQRGQRLRYSLMLEIGDLEGKKILDYGCGKGDFYSFLKDRDISVEYAGYDINPDLIDLARDKYPECMFRVFDIEESDIDEDFDYVFLCGVFNNRVENATDSMRLAMQKLFKHTRTALAVNAISSYSTARDIDINYVSPEETLYFALQYLTPFIALRHDAIPYDFTLFLYKKPNTPALLP